MNVWADVFVNINKAYMAMLMTTPMVTLEVLVMGAMYPDARIRIGVAALGIALLVAAFLAIRTQAGVTQGQFLRSMIPHHSAAILMCRDRKSTRLNSSH